MQTVDAISQTSRAHKDGVRTLYKFMAYPSGTRLGPDELARRHWVEALLSKGELYFATARELNDPFEASPRFRIPGDTPEDTIEAVLRPLRGVYAARWGWDEKQIAAREKSLREEIQSGQFHIRMQGLEESWRAKLATDYPMCCLSATRNSILMWSYYANGHGGVCVEFDATTVPFANASRVIYSDNYPHVPVPVADVEPELLTSLVLASKSNAWSHEQEYRLINMPWTTARGHGHILDDVFTWQTSQLAVIHPRHIIGVTVGASMPDGDIESIIRIARSRPLPIPVYQAKCTRDRFELEYIRIDGN